MYSSCLLFAVSAFTVAANGFRFTVWLGDKCTINGARPSDQELLVIPEVVNADGCMKYQLMEYGYDQSLMIRPETEDPAEDYLAFFSTDDCTGDPLFISPPASDLRERPVAGCTNYAAAGITEMSYKVIS